jgi:hypothetical protein
LSQPLLNRIITALSSALFHGGAMGPVMMRVEEIQGEEEIRGQDI